MKRYTVLIGEIAKRGIKKKAIAKKIGICDKSLRNKLNGTVPFTWPEAKMICHTFFPDISVDKLFYEETEERVTK
jgi:DNA-binding XRE family transcriptional regulator